VVSIAFVLALFLRELPLRTISGLQARETEAVPASSAATAARAG
jgi:hypothetical protein